MLAAHGKALGGQVAWRQNQIPQQPAARRGCRAQLRMLAASKLAEVPQAPPDPILGISEAFKADTSPDKLNLGVGAYRTEELKPYVLEVVKKAEKRMLEKGENKEYLPIEGLAEFRKATIDLLLGPNSKAVEEGRVATLQSLSGTGSLRIGAAFIAKFLPGTTVYVSNPTWGNHMNIFGDAGVKVEKYRYFDPETVGLDFEGMKEDISNAPEGSIILLHSCAHNPTGIDPTEEQWVELADLIKSKKQIPFFDIAYQGFATGSLDQDAAAPRLFVDRGVGEAQLMSQSYSKNLGLYGERVGAFTFIGQDADTAKRVLSQCKRIARAIYSNPPVHGARIVAEVVGDEATFNEWRAEMEGMAGRIAKVRRELHGHLQKINPDKNWDFIIQQIGMFSFTGLTPAQVENMTNKWKVFMTKDGRISLAGLNSARAEYLAQAIDDSVRNH